MQKYQLPKLSKAEMDNLGGIIKEWIDIKSLQGKSIVAAAVSGPIIVKMNQAELIKDDKQQEGSKDGEVQDTSE